MRITVFLNSVGLGGTEKAAALWANALRSRGHAVELISPRGGVGLGRFAGGIEFHETPDAAGVAARLRAFRPDAVHTHQPGWPNEGDMLGEALTRLGTRVPVIQTNVFGHLLNPADGAWTSQRAFVSWTSCVQAAHRSGLALDRAFFRRATVVSNPLTSPGPASAEAVASFRSAHGVRDDEVLFGKLARPDPVKWSNLATDGFAMAVRANDKIKFVVREAPAESLPRYRALVDKETLLSLPATADEGELRLMMSSIDVLLHTAKLGESFGYGIAEGMILGKPVITNCTPRGDQAQVELVEDGVCGYLASSPVTIRRAILKLASDRDRRNTFGANAAARIKKIADLEASTTRLEALLQAAVDGRDNPFQEEDVARAREAVAHLRKHRFGHDPLDVLTLGAIELARPPLRIVRGWYRAARGQRGDG